MAAKQSGKAATGAPDAKTAARISPQAIRKIWGAISIGDWKSLLTITDQRPEGGQWTIHNDRIHGVCPFHQDSKPSFIIDTGKKYAKCHGCQRYFWNPIAFWTEFRSVVHSVTTYAEALKDLKDRFSLSDIPVKVMQEMTRRWKHRQMKKLVHLVTQAEIVEAIKADPNDPRYAHVQRALRYLDFRNLPRDADIYERLPLGVLPPELYLETELKGLAPKHNLEPDEMWGMAKAYLNKPFLEDTSWLGSIIMFTGDNPNEPCGVKFRQVPVNLPSKDHPDPKVFMWVKDEIEDDQHGLCGLFGTPAYLRLISSGQLRQFHIVEGEFDALNIIANQLKAGDINFMCLSGGGGNVPALDFMKEFGLEHVYVVGDKDEGGEKFAKNILESTLHMTMHVFKWPDSLIIPGKPKMDPDDAVKHFGLDRMTREFRDGGNFEMPYQWASQRALLDMVGIEINDVKTLCNKAGSWGCYVRDSAEQDEYIRILLQRFPNLNAGTIKAKITNQDANEDAFLDRILGALRGRLYVIGQVQDHGATVLRVFDTQTNQIYDFRLHDHRQIANTIEALTGGDVYKFVREQVGDPGFMEGYDELLAIGKPFYLEQTTKMTGYVAHAVSRLAATLTRQGNIRYLGTGFHIVRRVINGVEHIIGYLVNGMLLFKCDFSDDGVWRRCAGPTDENVVVFAEPDHYPALMYPQFVTEAALNEVPKLTIAEVYERLRRVLDAGWRFKHQDTATKLLAGFLMVGYVSDIFSRQPVVMINAEHSSGKSTLIGGLIGGTAKRILHLVQPSLFTDNYTLAGIKNICNNARFILCLDEFEDKGGIDLKSKAVSAVLGLLRPLANDGGVTIQGSSGAAGRVVQYNIRTPVITAAIRGVIAPEDLSRFIHVELDRDPGRDSPDTTIAAAFGGSLDIIRELREQLPLVMFRNVAALVKCHDEIVEEFRNGIDVRYGDIARSREQYYSILAVMKLAGIDYHGWIKAHYQANEGLLARIAGASLSNDILKTLLSAPVIDPKNTMDESNDQRRTIKAMLASTSPETLNSTGTGVFYHTITAPDDPKKVIGHLLIVDWSIAKEVYLRNSEWSRRMPADIKNLASRNKHHLNDDYVLRAGVLEALSHQLHGTPIHDVSVFNVNDFVSEANISRKTVKVEGMEDFDVADEFAKDVRAYTAAHGKKEEGTGTSKQSPSIAVTRRPNDDFDY